MSVSLETEAPTREEELARLARALRLGRGFRLYLARSLPGPPRAALIAELHAAVGGGLRVFDARPGLEHLRAALEADLAGETPRAVCVTGIETWVPAGPEGAGSPFVRNLNASRDRFAATVPCPLVLWGADHVLQALQRGAPDFFSVASGIYLFPAEPLSTPEVMEEQPTLESAARWLREVEILDERLREIGLEPEGTDSVDRIATLNLKVVRLLKLAAYEEAESVARETYDEARRLLGPDAAETLASTNNLASLYEETGRYPEAEPLFVATLEARRRTLGDEARETLTSANNLGNLYAISGRFDEAESLLSSVLEARRSNLGPDDPHTLSAANNLANLYAERARFEEAETLLRSTLEAYSRLFGAASLYALMGLNNLAGLLQRTARYAEAEPLYKDALETAERTLGRDHPCYLTIVNNYALLLGEMDRHRDALALLEDLVPLIQQLPEAHQTRKAIESNLHHLSGIPSPLG